MSSEAERMAAGASQQEGITRLLQVIQNALVTAEDDDTLQAEGAAIEAELAELSDSGIAMLMALGVTVIQAARDEMNERRRRGVWGQNR